MAPRTHPITAPGSSSTGSQPCLDLDSTCVLSLRINSLRSLVLLLYFLGDASDVVKCSPVKVERAKQDFP